jgi:hypothetical protein
MKGGGPPGWSENKIDLLGKPWLDCSIIPRASQPAFKSVSCKKKAGRRENRESRIENRKDLGEVASGGWAQIAKGTARV